MTSDRQDSHRLLNDLDPVAVDECAQARAERHLSGSGAGPRDLAGLAAALHARPQTTATTSPRGDFLRQCAPMALIDGAWLQRVIGIDLGHTDVSLKLGRLYAHELGDGDHTRNHANLFGDLLRSEGIALPFVGTELFAQSTRLADASFTLPAFWLALSRRPRAFLGEIIGVTLWYYATDPFGAPPWGDEGFFALHRPQANTERLGLTLAAASDYVRQRGQAGEREPDVVARIWSGLDAASALSNAWRAGLTEVLCPDASDPAQCMAELLRSKRFFARGYHHEVRLANRSLEKMLNAENTDAHEVMAALASSRYIVPGDAEASIFPDQLVSFGQPMFRVFTEEELRIIRAWIDGLDPAPEARTDEGVSRPLPSRRTEPQRSPAPVPRTPVRTPRVTPVAEPIDTRSLYHRLLNVESHRGAVATADAHLARLLAEARSAAKTRAIPSSSYDGAAFDRWFYARYEAQIDAYQPLQGEPDSPREVVLWRIRQFTPTAFVDGGWLQRAFFARTCFGPTENALFTIYWDEIGNGVRKQNHSNVYRQVLAQCQIEPPPFGTEAFSHWPGFIDSAFDPGAFQLSLSVHSRKYFPELLGANLAIELAGIGGQYMLGAAVWRHYGIDDTFLRLHNTIDNAATGHAAAARVIVRSHLERILARRGRAEADREWERVWTGVEAVGVAMARYHQKILEHAQAHVDKAVGAG